MPKRRTNTGAGTSSTLSDHTKDRTGNGNNHDNLLLAGIAAYEEAGFPPGSAGDRALNKLRRKAGR